MYRPADPFRDYRALYGPEYDPDEKPVSRPQPCDFVLTYFQGMYYGSFIDVGAFDGISWSNSLPLEKYLGWKGLAVEPIQEQAQAYSDNRKTPVFHGCAWSHDGHIDFQQVEGYGAMLSGIVDSFVPEHTRRIEEEISRHSGSTSVIKSKCVTLETLLDYSNATHINYLSIDAECAELEILKGFNWEKHSVDLISVEDNGYNDNKASGVMDFLYEKGYFPINKIQNDVFYAKHWPLERKMFIFGAIGFTDRDPPTHDNEII